jgi:poly(A) polymerase/tRNA nucleotidyltransferase (CCA-adding enzyme)
MDLKIPKEIIFAIKTLKKTGFEAYLVGGCVRDVLERKKPNDWDIATNATPKEIQKIFKKSFYDNKFLTVKVITNSKDPTLKEIEITTFRSEASYTDHRHPDKVKPAKTIEEDLSRRDFTVNAMAMELNLKLDIVSDFEFRISDFNIIDPFGGQRDLENKIIRAVGDPKERFSEDALRLLRAVRFATTLGEGWKIEEKTKKAIKENAHLIQKISKERIKEELEKIIMSPLAYEGFLLLHKTGLLKYIIPELEMGVGVSQNRHHIYTIFEHSLLSLKYAAKYNYSLEVRLAALLHDIAKPQTKRGEWPDATFYNHDIVGAKIARNILYRLRFPKKVIEKVELLVKNHMFFYDPEVVTEYSVRKLLRKVGKENIKDLLCLRIADRKGSGVPKAKPYRLRHLEYMIEKVSRDPISVQMLKVNGNDVMKILNIQPGPKVGLILNALLAEVLESPEKNNKNYLLERIKEVGEMSEEELKKAGKIVEEKKMEIEEELKKKYWVK